MNFWTDKFNIGETAHTTGAKVPVDVISGKIKKPLFERTQSSEPLEGEITMIGSREIYADRIKDNDIRSKYLKKTFLPTHTVKKGETPAKIAKKYGIETAALLAANGMDTVSATNLQIGDKLIIPPTITVKNVENIDDVAAAMGLSKEFILCLKKIEDGGNLPDNKFHNTPYKDEAGVLTIGIGHVVKPGEKQKLSDAEVCTLLVQDLLKVEENLIFIMGGRENYNKLPQPIKEVLIDMSFNKGVNIVGENKDLVWRLKNGKYESAINLMTYSKSNTTDKEMSGLVKRRLFEISIAIRIYNGKIPQSNINTAQALYNRGVELLKEECKAKKMNFENQLVGYNREIQSYFNGKIELKYQTAKNPSSGK